MGASTCLRRCCLKLRREHAALSLGEFHTLVTDGPVYCYLRSHADERILVALNNSDSTREVVIPLRERGLADGARLRVLMGPDELDGLTVEDGALRVTVPPTDGVILAAE